MTSVLVCRTRREWRAIARLLRTHRPELAAKITLARLPELTAQMDESLTIVFSRPEYECLVVDGLDRRGAPASENEIASTIADVEAMLGLPTSGERERS